MDLGWKRMIPLALFWLLVLAGMLVDAPTSQTGFLGNLWQRRYGFGVFLGGAVMAVMLLRAMRVGRDEGARQAELREVR